MNRNIVYPGAIPQDTDILNPNRNAMIALGYLAQMALGTATVVDGLACTPTSPASLTVNVGPGSILSLLTIDTTAYGSLGADSNPLVKMGINSEGSTPFTLTAPATSGYSQNYLIEAILQESDTNATVLPYYNAANPSQPYSGPNNTGTAQNTLRQEIVSLQLKAGAPATTGSQTTPAPDTGYVGLWVVTVANGQTAITSSSIAEYPGAPFLAAKLPTVAISQALWTDTGVANAYVITTTPALASHVPGLTFQIKITNANTGASTLNVGAGAAAITHANGTPLQPGELPAGGIATVVDTGTGYQLLSVGTPIGAMAVVGEARGLAGSGPGAAKTASWTAQELVAETALGGVAYKGVSLSLAFNGATTGAGGMDTGATPTSGDLSIYAIYDPTTNAWSTLGCLGSTSNGPVYAGTHMPAGYTASALIWAGVTDGSGDIVAFQQKDRRIWIARIRVASAVTTSTYTLLSLAAAVPAAAKLWFPEGGQVSTGAVSNIFLAPDSTGSLGRIAMWSSQNNDETTGMPIPIVTAQSAWYQMTAGQTWDITVNGYEI